MKQIIEIANHYMADNDGELPLLVLARNENETRVMCGKFREKHAQRDQSTFINTMRLAMMVYGYTSYEFIVKPEFDTDAMQMTMHVWAVGSVSADSQTSEFFTVEDNKLEPYYDEMPIGGFIAQLLPTNKLEIPAKVEKLVRGYVQNSTYVVPVNHINDLSKAKTGIEELMSVFGVDNSVSV